MATQQTTGINIERQPNQERLNQLGVSKWSIWTKEVSEFPWTYRKFGFKAPSFQDGFSSVISQLADD